MNHRFPHTVFVTSLMLAGTAICGAETGTPDLKDGYQVLATYQLGGDGGWDLLTIQAHRLYISRATRTMVVDADNGKLIGDIPGAGVHGIAIVPEKKRGFITNGKENTVTIFDLDSLAVIDHVSVGTKPDAIAYDPASKQVFVCNNGGTSLSVIEPAAGKVVATIDVGGAPELVAIDGKGRLYTNLEDKNEVGVVDTSTLKAVARWPLAPGDGPSGIAVDPAHHRVFSVCHDSKTMEILDTDSGKVISTQPIGAGADGAAFDASTGNIFAPNADGTLTVIHESDPMTFIVLQTLATKPYARNITIDEESHRLYLITAEPEAAVAGSIPGKGRPKFVSGTFTVLVIGKLTGP